MPISHLPRVLTASLSTLDTCSLPPPQTLVQDTANESHLFLPSQPPASPLLHFIFYTFSCPFGATTPGIPTPYQHCLLFSTDYDLIVGTLNVYKLPPFKDGWSIRLLHINPVVFSPSFSYAFVSRLVALALAHMEPLSTLCLVSLSSHLISYQSLSHRILSGTTNQPCSRYHSYIWSPPVVVPLGSQLWFPPVASLLFAPPFHPPYEEGPSSSITFSCLIAVGPPCLLSLLLAPWTSLLF